MGLLWPLGHGWPTSALTTPSEHVKKNQLCCVSVFLTNKEVSKSCCVYTALRHTHISTQRMSLKGHMTNGYLRTMTLNGRCHVQLVTAVLTVLKLFSSCAKVTSLANCYSIVSHLLLKQSKVSVALNWSCHVWIFTSRSRKCAERLTDLLDLRTGGNVILTQRSMWLDKPRHKKAKVWKLNTQRTLERNWCTWCTDLILNFKKNQTEFK